jgi:hypothetical protein
VTHLVEAPRQLDADASRSDADWAVDVALGVIGGTVGVGLAVMRAAVESPALRSAAGWRRPLVPARLQPRRLLADLARQGARHRLHAARGAERLLDEWPP